MAGYVGSPEAQAGAKRKMDGVLNLDSPERRLFECPLCLEILSGQIFQCHRGHLICSTCEKQYSKCPTCQMSLSKKIRNIAMEELALKIPLECPNGLLGCKALCKAADIRAHLDNECAYEKKNLCGMIGLKCNELVKLIDWKTHLQKHGIMTIQGSEASVQQILPPLQGSPNSTPNLKFKPICLMAFDAAFVFKTQMDERKNVVMWELRSIGLERPCDYYFKLTVVDSGLSKKYPLGSYKGRLFDAESEDSGSRPVFLELLPRPENVALRLDLEVKVKKWSDRVKSDAATLPVVRSVPTASAAVVNLTRTPSVNENGNAKTPRTSPRKAPARR